MMCNLYIHTMKLHPGGSDSRNDPGVRLVYSDNTHRAEHAHMRPLNEWQILELGHFEDGNFEKKISQHWGC